MAISRRLYCQLLRKAAGAQHTGPSAHDHLLVRRTFRRWRWRWRFLQFVERDGDRLLELRVVAVDHIRRRLLHVDVRRHSLVLDDPTIFGPDREVRGGDASSVDELRKAEDADQSAPRALADDRSQLELAEHPGKQIAA